MEFPDRLHDLVKKTWLSRTLDLKHKKNYETLLKLYEYVKSELHDTPQYVIDTGLRNRSLKLKRLFKESLLVYLL